MRRVIKTVGILGGAAIVSGTGHASGPLSMWYYGTPLDASDKLALQCADRGAAVIEQDERHVICQRENSGVLARYMFSGRGGSAPMLMVRFSLLKDGPDTRIQASQWIEVQSALGQSRRTELDDRKHEASLREVLHGIDAHDFPSSAAETAMPAAP